MASCLDPRQVLAYLNQLGYKNITAEQLRDFMKDLKKLIKYEEKYKPSDIENIPPAFPYHKIAPPTSVKTSAESLRAQQIAKKEIVSVEVKKRAGPCQCVNYDLCNKKQSFQSSTPHQSETGTDRQKPPSRESEAASNREPTVTSLSGSSRRPKSCEPCMTKSKPTVKFRGNQYKPKASFILPRAPIKTFKSDPVALYHKYEQGWKKHKLPGEDNHSQLRWIIRERMIGEPSTMSGASSMDGISRGRIR